MVLRDQTASVVGRHRNQRRESPISPGKLPGTTPQTSSFPKDVAYGLESHALAFLFSMPVRDWRTSHGHLDFLQPLYQKVSSDSPLALATSWLAVLMMGTCDKGRPYPLEALFMTKFIKSIQADLRDPISSVKDETLTAVILVTYGEHLRDQRYGSRSTCILHQEGAEALIRKRGVLNFQDSTSLALFDAVRHNAVNLAICGRGKTKNWDLWNLHGDMGQLCDSYTPATELDACGVTMIALANQLESKDFPAGMTLRESLLKLLERLRSWQYRVPSEWLPRPATCSMLRYPSPEVCYLFDHWYLLQLGASHLTKELDMRTNATEIPGLHYLCEMEWIDNIIASEDSLLGRGPNKKDLLSPTEPKQSAYVDDHFPCATAQQCYCAPLGSRLFGQTLDRLDVILSKALEDLTLPTKVALRYREVVSWVRRERATIRQAFPSAES